MLGSPRSLSEIPALETLELGPLPGVAKCAGKEGVIGGRGPVYQSCTDT